MPHYICTGSCKTVSDNLGTCEASDCPKLGQALEECNCEDEQHEGRQKGETTEL